MPPTVANSGQALQQLQTAQSQAQDPNAILQGQNQQFGIPAAQQTVTGLRGAIDNTTRVLNQVAPSVMGRTAQSLVTSAQANRQIANEQAPVSQTLNAETGKYNEANTDLTQKQQQAKDAANGIYTGQQNKLSYLQNLYSTLYGSEQDAAKQAEAKRQFDAQQALATQKVASSGSSGSSKASAASQRQSDVGTLNKALQDKVGKDGYTSPYDYNAAKAAWVTDGYSASDFESIFGKYKNPKQPKGQYK